MKPGGRLISIIISVIVVNALGILLRFYNFDSYIIIIGFRFHISLVLPFFIIFRSFDTSKLKEILTRPSYNKTFQPLLWIFFPFIMLLVILFIMKKIDIGDPEYFYEFGLSSIFDLPLYIIWNLPQLLLFASFLILIQPEKKTGFWLTVAMVILLFAFQFIPLSKEKVNYLEVITLIFAAMSAGIMLKYYQNIYWFAILFFMVFWINLLAFGSSSQMMLHIIFAAEYSSWEGFFEVGKSYALYLLPAQSALTFLILSLSAYLRKNKS